MSASRIEAHLAAARQCRLDDDPPGTRHALAQAVDEADQLGDPHWTAVCRWRAAKAAWDDQDAPAVLAFVDPLLALEDPFADYLAGLKAVEPATTLVWDTLGYGDPRPEQLWAAWTRHHRSVGDPYLAAMGEVKGAWARACQGDVDALHALLERWTAMTPRRFGTGPHRHAEAPDATSSLFWVQRDVARTALRGATWCLDERLAWMAAEALEDAMEDTGAVRLSDFWFLEPMCRAHLRFGGLDAGGYLDAWRDAAQTLAHERAPFHRALQEGELARAAGATAQARGAFERAHEVGAGLGPEWSTDALVEACAAGAERWDEAEALVSRYSLGAFAGRTAPASRVPTPLG